MGRGAWQAIVRGVAKESDATEELNKNISDIMRYLSVLNFYRLLYLFLAVLGLCCCVGSFPSCGEWGLLSRCTGFSLQWLLLFAAQALGPLGLRGGKAICNASNARAT